jgi:hypothetical protein
VWEFNAALWQAAKKRPGFILLVVAKPCKLPTLSDHIRRCELFGVSKDEARRRFREYMSKRDVPMDISFPGRVFAVSNIPIRLPRLFMGRDDALEAIEAALKRDERGARRHARPRGPAERRYGAPGAAPAQSWRDNKARVAAVSAPAPPCIQNARGPIQMSAIIQIALRTGTGMNRPARMAACGIDHANRLMRGLPSQSRELWAVSLAMPDQGVQQEAAPLSLARSAWIGGHGTEP